MTIEIPFRLVDLNSYISKERANRFGAAALKKKVQQQLYYTIATYRNRGVIRHCDKPVKLWFTWIIPDGRRRDLDNLSFSTKFIQDTLVNAKILDDDSIKYITELHHSYEIQKGKWAVILTIEEA